jgi:phosphoribosyl-AMP cyclohydrolase
MVAWMDDVALERTLQTRRATYYSRSRQEYWVKGETSGHTQTVHDVRLDCDGDVILLQIEQIGGIACHTGRESCFFRRLVDGQWQISDPVLKSPGEIYGEGAHGHE